MKIKEVVAGIIKKDGKILATQRGYGEFKGMWEFPGGKIEEGETKEEALRREIEEELKADIKNIEFFLTRQYEYPTFCVILHCYFCELESETFTLLEHDDAKWLKKEELDQVEWLPADIEIIERLKKEI